MRKKTSSTVQKSFCLFFLITLLFATITKEALSSVSPLGGAPVIIGPDLGWPPPYNGSDFISSLSEQNTDLLALQYREVIEAVFSSKKTKIPDYYLILSGALIGQVYDIKSYTGPSTSDIDLSLANITALAAISKLATGFLSFDYDPEPPNSLSPPQIGPRASNSRVFLDQGFITIGDLSEKEGYLSVGQMYLPFGQFNSFMINSPLTGSLFTLQERPVILSYNHTTNTTELDVKLFAYQGETATANTSTINEEGFSVAYFLTQSKWSGNLGMAYITNVADAGGLLDNGQNKANAKNISSCKIFTGFASPCSSGSLLVYKVPGIDLHGYLTIGDYNLIAEYMSATRPFSPLNLTFNNRGAKPAAFDVEGAYNFKLFKNKPSLLAIGYGFTKQALALLLPAQQYSVTFTTALWRNTTENLGFQHNINYSASDTATGQQLPAFLAAGAGNLGKTSNTILLTINAFF